MNNPMNSKQIEALVAQHPVVDDLIQLKETIWLNPSFTTLEMGLPFVGLNQNNIDDARDRLARFAPYLMSIFPETKISKGIIESELVSIPKMQQTLEAHFKQDITGKLWLKKGQSFANLRIDQSTWRYLRGALSG